MTPLGCSGGSQERLMVPAVALISSTVGTAEGAVQEYRERESGGGVGAVSHNHMANLIWHHLP